ncbi:MAG TPA: DUF3108 domain-containing protein [Kofleriaceae bacterium]|nr:DUF3108 domain-containing protein [Kofleriaceae bacterium]
MRCLIAVMLLAACGHPSTFPVQPLPELVSTVVAATPLAVSALALEPGESLIWDVHWNGVTIGRAELAVSEQAAHSRFSTEGIARAMASVEYELETVLDRAAARPTSASERLRLGGETRQVAETFDGASYAIDGQFAAVPGGNPGQTLHSALGAIRAWAAPDARPGYLFVVHAGQLIRVDVARPIPEELQGTPALRVECRVRLADDQPATISITAWLTRDQKRTPVRIEIRRGNEQITAELIDADAA